MTLPRKKVAFLLGPTASGKTAMACALRGRFAFEIVSVDSALVYREMNIGTAKPDAATLAGHPHRLIDLIDPDQAYSAADFRRDAMAAIDDIHAAGRMPLLVGGTMMYVKALIEGLSKLPPADPAIRAVIGATAAMHGWPALHAQLAAFDPPMATRLSPNDSQRIQRALEVHQITGVAMSTLQTRATPNLDTEPVFPFDTAIFALTPSNRDVLHMRIAARFDAMIDAGLVDEVARLRTRYALDAGMPSMRCVGYRQAWQYLDGDISLDEMRLTGVSATRQLAKRQLTWLRSTAGVTTIDCLDPAAGDQTAHHLQQWQKQGDAV